MTANGSVTACCSLKTFTKGYFLNTVDQYREEILQGNRF